MSWNLGQPLTEEARLAWVKQSSIPSPVVDSVLPPALAFEIGRDAARRVAAGHASGEGVYAARSLGRRCDCDSDDLALTDKHAKRLFVGPDPVMTLFRDKRR